MKIIDKLALIHVVDHKILSTRSKNSEIWFLPGGKREFLENDIEALTREIGEELGVELVLDTLRYIGTFVAQAANHPDGVMVKMTCYSADYAGTLLASAEIAEFDYFTTADMEKISPVDKIIFSFLKDKGLIE